MLLWRIQRLTYENLVPYPNGAYFAEVPRLMLSILNRGCPGFTITDVVLYSFAGGFSDGAYGYLVPFWSRGFPGRCCNLRSVTL